MWIMLHTQVQTKHNKLTTAQKQAEREKKSLQQEYKGALEQARLQIVLGGDVHWGMA